MMPPSEDHASSNSRSNDEYGAFSCNICSKAFEKGELLSSEQPLAIMWMFPYVFTALGATQIADQLYRAVSESACTLLSSEASPAVSFSEKVLCTM
jgi:hypothetical protein